MDPIEAGARRKSLEGLSKEPTSALGEDLLVKANGLDVSPEPPKGWREQLRERQMEKLVELCRRHGIGDEEIARAITSAAEAPESA
jgi:hypothetical protein